MWLYTKIGFFSVVENRNDKEELMVRSRFYTDIVKLIKILEKKRHRVLLYKNTGTDYKYRIFLNKKIFSEIVKELIEDIDYDNFKDEVHDGTSRDYAYMQCWSAMREAQY